MKEIEIRTVKEPNLSGNFSISNLNVLLAEKDMVEELHRHDFFFVLAIKTGTGEHQIDFIPYSVSNYSVFILRPGQVHQLHLKQGSKGYLLGFDHSFYSPQEPLKKEMLSTVCRKEHYALKKETFHRVFPVLEAILFEFSTQQKMYRECIKSNLDLFFTALFRHCTGTEMDPKNDSFANQTLEKLLDLIDLHLYQNKQVQFYAEKLNLTPYQINAVTKKALGKTCSQLINEHIILEAKRNLIATPNQVNEIAFYLGYEDPSYFIRFFKKQIGLTPEVFRQSF